jgi:hypothetical protein
MVKDRRYTTVKKIITGGYMHSFGEIFDIVPKSVVARDLGINNMRFSKLINQPALFSLKDTFRFAALLEVDDMVLISLIYSQIQANRKSKK